MQEKDFTILDFDKAVALAIRDPEAFEEYRLKVIETLIERTPERTQLHLRRLQWRIKQVKRSSSNPFAACVKLHKMMWHSPADHSGMMESLENFNTSYNDINKQPHTARVIAFRPKGNKPRGSSR